MPPEDRPLLLKLGIGLLALHELLVIGLAALLGTVAGVFVLMGASGFEPKLVAAGGVLAGVVLAVAVTFALFSLVTCAMAWRGTRRWIQVLLGVAIVNCIVLVPNPLGILAAVFCVLGGLEHLDNSRGGDTIAAPAAPAAPVESGGDD